MNPQGPNKKGLMPLNPEFVRNEIKLLEAKIAMREARKDAYRRHTAQNRTLVREFIKVSVGRAFEPLMNAWISTSQAFEKTECEIYDVEIMELKSRVAIQQAALGEAENPTPQIDLM